MKLSGISERIRSNFRHSTLSFIFIIAYVNIFPLIFGPENSIVAVIFTIMMSASMVRDLTATPVKHLFLQSAVLVWMGIAAFLVTSLPALFSFLINFFTLLLILYAFTYEYSNHIYFPYILSYLFLIFISPVHAGQLPMRILGMLAGALSIMLYQWVMGRKRVQETARDVLTEMIDDICQYISQRTAGNPQKADLSAMRHKLCRLSRTVYERRQKTLCVSDADFSMRDAGRGLEHRMILIQEFPETLSGQDKIFLSEIVRLLNQMRIFLQQDGHVRPSLTAVPPLPVGPHRGKDNLLLLGKSLIILYGLCPGNVNKSVHFSKTHLSPLPFPVQPQKKVDRIPYLLCRCRVVSKEAARGTVPALVEVAGKQDDRLLCGGRHGIIRIIPFRDMLVALRIGNSGGDVAFQQLVIRRML